MQRRFNVVRRLGYNSNTHGELKSVRVKESSRVVESIYRGNLTEGTEKSIRVMEVSSYRGSNYRESTVVIYIALSRFSTCEYFV